MADPALVQRATFFNGTGDTHIVLGPITVTLHNTLIVAFGYDYKTGHASGTTSISDTGGNTWNGPFFDFDGGYGHTGYFFAENCAAGSTTITIMFSASQGYRGGIIHEVSGLLTSGSFETDSFHHNNVSGAITPLTDNQYIFCILWNPSSTGTPTGVDSGFTFQGAIGGGGGSYFMSDANTVLNPLATVDPQFTISGSPSNGWQSFIVAFRPTETGPSGVVLTSDGVATVSLEGGSRATSALAASGGGSTALVGADAQPIPQRNYMSKGDTFENDWLKLIFNAVTITGIARDDASPLTVLEVSLHTADPGEAGSQTTNETAYTGYARIPVARTSGGWTVTGSSVSPAANIDFGNCSASPGSTITHAAVGTAHTGAGKILYSGPLSPQIAIAVGVIPRMTTASVITED